jgi:hypothetical protein
MATTAQHVDPILVVVVTPPSAPKDRQQQAQHDANNDAGNDGKIKCGVAALDPNITGQTAQPFRRKSAPKEKAKKGYHDSEYQ